MKLGRTDRTWREAALTCGIVLVTFFAGSWALDWLSVTPFDPVHLAISGACMAAGWLTARRIMQLLSRRQH